VLGARKYGKYGGLFSAIPLTSAEDTFAVLPDNMEVEI
jgi:hypothetical protein